MSSAEPGSGLKTGDLDPTFSNSGLTPSDFVTTLLVDSQNRILAGHTHPEGESYSQRLVRLRPDGSLDSTFTPPTFGIPQDKLPIENLYAWQGDKILVTGAFDEVNGIIADGVVRLNSDGTLDPSFRVRHDFGATFAPQKIAVAETREAFLIAWAADLPGRSVVKLLKISANGDVDAQFRPRYNDLAGPLFNLIFPEPNGTLLFGASIAREDFTFTEELVRLGPDGAALQVFPSEPPFDARPTAMVQLPGGALVMAAESLGTRLTRFSPSGVVDADFNSGQGPDAPIYHLESLPDGRLLARGSFSQWNQQPRPRVALVLPDGRLDPTFAPASNQRDVLRSATVQGANRILLGGQFVREDGSFQSPIRAVFVATLTNTVPRVVKGPASAELEEGDNLALRVVADGFPRRAQWLHDGAPIEGATNEFLLRLGIGRADAGRYQLRLSNDEGSVLSEPAMIVVNPTPTGANLIRNPSFEQLHANPLPDPETGETFAPVFWKGVQYPRWWSSPLGFPPNFDGTEDALQGTNYVSLWANVNLFEDRVQTTNNALLGQSLENRLEPGSRYEFTAGSSHGESSEVADSGVEVTLLDPIGNRLSLGTTTVTNTEGWSRVRTTFLPSRAYDRMLMRATRPLTGSSGSVFVFLDRLGLRKLDLATPQFLPVPTISLAPWSRLELRNPLDPGSLADVVDSPARFELGGGPPSGALIDPATGILSWLPGTDQAGTNQSFTVIARSPSWPFSPATNRFAVRVQEGLALTLGRGWARAGQPAVLPVHATFLAQAGPTLAEIACDLQLEEGFATPEFAELSTLVERAEFTPLGSGSFHLRMILRDQALHPGTRLLGQLTLPTIQTPVSAATQVRVTGLTAQKSDGLAVEATRREDGQVFRVSREPALEAVVIAGSRVLRLYGLAGHRYRLETSEGTGPGTLWTAGREITATSFPEEIRDLDATAAALFVRAVEIQ